MGTCFSYTGLLLGGGGVGEQCCAFIRTAKAIKPKDDHGYCIVSGFIPDQFASVDRTSNCAANSRRQMSF